MARKGVKGLMNPDISIVHNTPAAIFELVGYYVCGRADYEQDEPIGFRSILLEAEALRHFVCENQCHRIRWGGQRPELYIYDYDIMEVVVPVAPI